MKIIFILLFIVNTIYGYKLNIEVFPKDSAITVNQKEYKNNNGKLSLNLEKGVYFISVCKENYICRNLKKWIISNDLNLKIKLKPFKSEVIIKSETPQSRIYVNDVLLKKNKLVFKKPQIIEIREKKDFYVENIVKLKIEPGETYNINLPPLKRVEKNLNIIGIQKDSSIRIDGKEVCKGSCNIVLKSGLHRLSIISDGYFPYERDIHIKDKDIVVKYKLYEKPEKFKIGLGVSYTYGRIIGGYPEINVRVNFKDKFIFKTDLLYIVNFSAKAEYYGIIPGVFYRLYKKNEFEFRIGGDFIFSKYIDNNKDFLLNGLGLTGELGYGLNKNLSIILDITNRLHYQYDKKYYDMTGNLGLVYSF